MSDPYLSSPLVPSDRPAWWDGMVADLWTYGNRTLTVTPDYNNLTIISSVVGNTVTVYANDTWEFTIDSNSLNLGSYEDVAFVVKVSPAHSDADALLNVRSFGGLIRIGQAAPTNANNGSLTVNSATAFTVLVAMSETSSITKYGSFTWWLKGFDTDPTPDEGFTLATGTFEIVRPGYQAVV